MSSQDKVVDNKHTRKLFREMAADQDAVYHRYRTEIFFHVFWTLAIVSLVYVNVVALGQGDWVTYAITFIQGVFYLKGLQMINPFLDLAEEEGLIIEEEEEL